MTGANLELVERLLQTVSWLSVHSVTDEPVAAPTDPNAEKIAAVLAQARKRRAEELSLATVRPLSAQTGKLLLLLVDMNLMDGAACDASDGFYDQLNLPPVATWVDLNSVHWVDGTCQENVLICWVPEEYVARAQAGIEVNPEECIGWACELAPDLHRDLASAPGVRGSVHLMGADG